MSNEVTVLTLSREQLSRLIEEKIDIARRIGEGIDTSVLRWKVDRKFLRMNFGWSRRKIEGLVRDGRIREVLTGDGKSIFYELRECKRIYDEENLLK